MSDPTVEQAWQDGYDDGAAENAALLARLEEARRELDTLRETLDDVDGLLEAAQDAADDHQSPSHYAGIDEGVRFVVDALAAVPLNPEEQL